MKKISFLVVALIALSFVTPLVSFAQLSTCGGGGLTGGTPGGVPGTGGGADLTCIFTTVLNIINIVLVPLLFAVGFIIFLYTVFKYFIAGGDEAENRANGAKYIMFGIIGFFVMISVWGLVNILLNTFGIAVPTPPSPPQI